MKKLLNGGWKFLKTELGTRLDDIRGRVSDFVEVQIPHDFLISDVNDFYTDATGWYYRDLIIYKCDSRYELIFDGIYMDSTVYINGHKAGEWKYGYSQFILDITDFVDTGHNEVLVSANYRCPNSRWYSGAGIYRNVWLCNYADTHIPENGIYVHSEKEDGGYQLRIDTEICGKGDVSFELTEDNGQVVEMISSEDSVSESVEVPEGSCAVIKKKFGITGIKEWSPQEPVLYTLNVKLRSDNRIVQAKRIRIGFRDIELNPDKGLILNGQRLKLNGVCLHHDLGALGAAYNNCAMRRRLRQLREMGVNAIRLSHNMYDPQAIELMDEMGFLVISEAFDMWERSKTEFDYARFFKEWHERDVESWIKRDRNHPSVFLWSIGNEIYDTHADENGLRITIMLKDLVKKFDYMGNAHPTFGSNYMPWENAQKCADELKVVGYNYAENYYKDHHEKHPDWIIYGSETYSIVQSRGIYHFPLSESILTDRDLQCSSLGNSTTSWGAESIEDCICKDRDTYFSMGQFLWTGYDYIGEPTPYHTKNSYFGLIDTAGFYKDAYYVWKSAWTDYKKDPFVYVFPYWNFNNGQLIDVRVVSNAPGVELFLNGESIGSQVLDHEAGSGHHVIADYIVPYREGELKAIAFDESGKEVSECVRRSFGDTDHFDIKVESGDLVFAEISALDKNGNPVENARDVVNVEVTGGKLLGLDNGDSTDMTSYQSDTKALFAGKLLAIIRPDTKDEDVVIDVHPVEENVHIRQIRLITDDAKILSPDNPVIKVRAEILPANAADNNISFELLNTKGTRSSLASIKVQDNECEITGHYDGEFILRCHAEDSEGVVRVMSSLEFKVEGMGTAYLNPYELIPGNAYADHIGRVSNGNEHGVATDRGNVTTVIYKEIDFGNQGSDLITVPIFALSDDEYPIQIWEGIPGEEDAALLADVVYHKKSIWNVYQEDSWRLDKRLYGIRTISFVTHNKVHIKGFSFERQLKAFYENSAIMADSIYGDTFTKTSECVEEIGNNVTLSFENMDFGERQATQVVVFGRARAGVNTIHLRMKNKETDEQIKEVLEFPKCDEYQQISFDITALEGKWDIEFIFLPGSNFDLRSFWFK